MKYLLKKGELENTLSLANKGKRKPARENTTNKNK
jgi:hypothetical protein